MCTPNEAYESFMRTDMDAVVINNYLMLKELQILKKENFQKTFDMD